jgi:hypothetical protein
MLHKEMLCSMLAYGMLLCVHVHVMKLVSSSITTTTAPTTLLLKRSSINIA